MVRHRTGVPLEVDDDAIDELSDRAGSDVVAFANARTRLYTGGVRLIGGRRRPRTRR